MLYKLHCIDDNQHDGDGDDDDDNPFDVVDDYNDEMVMMKMRKKIMNAIAQLNL